MAGTHKMLVHYWARLVKNGTFKMDQVTPELREPVKVKIAELEAKEPKTK